MLPSLADILGGDDCACGACENAADLTAEEATRLLSLGRNPNKLQIDDIVVRSTEGKETVRFPKDDTEQRGRIVEIFDGYRIDGDGQVYNGFIDIALAPNTIRTYPANLKDYVRAS